MRSGPHASTVDQSTPIQTWGYDDTGIAENRHLTAADLDSAAPDHLLFVQHVSGHLAYVNTRVLTESGITSDSPDPQGGRIHRTPTGQPTGLLEEPGRYEPRTAGGPGPRIRCVPQGSSDRIASGSANGDHHDD